MFSRAEKKKKQKQTIAAAMNQQDNYSNLGPCRQDSKSIQRPVQSSPITSSG